MIKRHAFLSPTHRNKHHRRKSLLFRTFGRISRIPLPPLSSLDPGACTLSPMFSGFFIFIFTFPTLIEKIVKCQNSFYVFLCLCEIALTTSDLMWYQVEKPKLFIPGRTLFSFSGGILQHDMQGWSLGKLPPVRVRPDGFTSSRESWEPRIIGFADGSQSRPTNSRQRSGWISTLLRLRLDRLRNDSPFGWQHVSTIGRRSLQTGRYGRLLDQPDPSGRSWPIAGIDSSPSSSKFPMQCPWNCSYCRSASIGRALQIAASSFNWNRKRGHARLEPDQSLLRPQRHASLLRRRRCRQSHPADWSRRGNPRQLRLPFRHPRKEPEAIETGESVLLPLQLPTLRPRLASLRGNPQTGQPSGPIWCFSQGYGRLYDAALLPERPVQVGGVR